MSRTSSCCCKPACKSADSQSQSRPQICCANGLCQMHSCSETMPHVCDLLKDTIHTFHKYSRLYLFSIHSCFNPRIIQKTRIQSNMRCQDVCKSAGQFGSSYGPRRHNRPSNFHLLGARTAPKILVRLCVDQRSRIRPCLNQTLFTMFV